MINGKIEEVDILIEGERIKKVGKIIRGDESINIRKKIVIPAFIDVHVHLRDFKERHKETIETGTKAAISSGITTLIEMPNTEPSIDNMENLKKRISIINKKSYVDVGIFFKFTDKIEKDVEDVFGYKFYMDKPFSDETFIKSFELGKIVCYHAEDYKIIEENKKKFREHHKIRNCKAEVIAIQKVAKNALIKRKKVHICHISCSDSLKYLNEYTTCEVTPHHLLLNKEHYEEYGGIAKVNPPLKSKKDNIYLLEALKKGKIDIIASDHAPHSISEKESEDSPSGIPNLDVMAKIFLTLVKRNVISLYDLWRLYSRNPAEIFGIKEKGYLREGYYADMVVVDFDAKGKIDPDEFFSKAKYSPFEGFKYHGDVEIVFLRGKIVYYDGDIVEKRGRFIFRDF